MELLLKLDTTAGEAGMRAALDVISRVYGTNPTGPATSPAPAGPTPAPVPAPQPPMPPTGAAPAPLPAPSAPPTPAPPAPVASPVPAPSPAPAAASPGGITQAQFGQQVNAFAEKFGAKATKARFAEMAAAFQQPGWTSTNAVPADQYDGVIAWFKTE